MSSAENDLREAEVDQAVEWALFWLFIGASWGPESGLGVETTSRFLPLCFLTCGNRNSVSRARCGFRSDFQVEFMFFLGPYIQFGQKAQALIPSHPFKQQARLGQPKQGGQTSLDEKGMFTRQVSLGQPHFHRQPPRGRRCWLMASRLASSSSLEEGRLCPGIRRGPSPAWRKASLCSLWTRCFS